MGIERNQGHHGARPVPRRTKNEEHASISSVDNFVASVLQEVCVPRVSRYHSPVDL